MEIAHSFEEAAKSYQHNPTALHPGREHVSRGRKRTYADSEQRRRIHGHGRVDGGRRDAAIDPDGAEIPEIARSRVTA
jgi:hypothetical protein